MVSKSKTKKKQKLLNSLEENYDVEEQGLNQTAENVSKFQEPIVIIPRYEEVIKTQNKKTERFFKILKTFLIISVRADQQYVLKFYFINF